MSLCGWKNYLTYRFSRSTASIVGTALVTTPLRWRTCTASCVAETPGGLDIENLAGHAAEPPASCCISSIADIVARQDVVETSQRGCFISREPPMITRRSEEEGRGTIKDGAGTVALGRGAFSGDYSFSSRFVNGAGTNPFELLCASLSGFYSMSLSLVLCSSCFPPLRFFSSSLVHFSSSSVFFSFPIFF